MENIDNELPVADSDWLSLHCDSFDIDHLVTILNGISSRVEIRELSNSSYLFECSGHDFIIQIKNVVKKRAYSNFRKFDCVSANLKLSITPNEPARDAQTRKHQLITAMELIKRLGIAINAIGVSAHFGQMSTSFDSFERQFQMFLDDGILPILSLVSFGVIHGHDGKFLQTRGVGFFVGQEIHLELFDDNMATGIKRAIRVIHDMIVNGKITDEITFKDFFSERNLVMSTDDEKAIVLIKSI